jgi:Transposase DDE domain
VVAADRAYDVPAFVDRVAARGWHWLVRGKAQGATRFRDRTAREWAVRDLTRRHLPGRGRRWKGRGRAFKEAGWRAASLVGLWGRGQKEPLVVLRDLPARWRLPRLYERRFWSEPGFRSDKARGWQREQSQVRDPAHQERRRLALAWASLVALRLGAHAAEAKRAARRARALPPRRRPEHARESLVTLGLHAARRWLYRPDAAALRWRLPDPLAECWAAQWRRAQGFSAHLATVRP